LNYSYDHIHLMSPDPPKTAEFYQKMFNARLVISEKQSDGRWRSELSLNGTRILIAQTRNRQDYVSASGMQPSLDHFGIKTDNIEAAVADLKAKGVRFRDEIRVAKPGLKIAFLWAPENVLVELVEFAP
jgi:lactoylglutathione lyase